MEHPFLKKLVGVLSGVCLIAGLASCGSASNSSADGPSTNGKSATSSKSNASKDSEEGTWAPKTSVAKAMPDWRETYHCAKASEYRSIPDIGPNYWIFNKYYYGDDYKDDADAEGKMCVIITDQQTVNIPVILTPEMNVSSAEDDKFVGEMPVTFDSPDVGSWKVTVDATKINKDDVTGKGYGAYETALTACYNGDCELAEVEHLRFGDKGSISIKGGMTAVAVIGFDMFHEIVVIRRG